MFPPIRLGQVLLFSSIFLASALAAAQPDDNAEIPAALLKFLKGSKEDYVSKTLRPIRQYGENRDQISKKGVEQAEAARDAQMRAQFLAQEFGKDFDGDGRISTREMRTALERSLRHLKQSGNPEQYEKRLAKSLERSMKADKNSDSYVSFDELMQQAKRKVNSKRGRLKHINNLHDLLAVDPNKDGVLTITELRPLLDKTFATFDTNGNGWIDADEQLALRDVRNQQRRKSKPRVSPRQIAACELPPASKEAVVVVLGSYEGHALSSVAIAGRDTVTHTGTVTVEPGKTPIYLIASSYSHMVWDIKGATQRVERMVAFPRSAHGGAGVVGLPAGKVTFLEPGSCFKYFSDPRSGKARIAKATVGGALGRDVDAVLGAYSVSNMHVPSGRQEQKRKSGGTEVVMPGGKRYVITRDGVQDLGKTRLRGPQPPPGVDSRTWGELYRFSPGGVVTFDTKAIVSASPAEDYDVLPQQAGLVQLMQEGALRRLNDGFYLIEKPIARYPAGLNGAHSVKFMLGKGVPQPDGKPGHSCVVSEETGVPLHRRGRRC